MFTEYGLANSKRHLSQISIVANRNWVEGDGMVAMRNEKSGVTIPGKIDGKAYIDCLKRGLEMKSMEIQEKKNLCPAVKSERDGNIKKSGKTHEDSREESVEENSSEAK